MVNDYLSDTMGSEFTAKDFRTWHATVHAIEHSRHCQCRSRYAALTRDVPARGC